jgi:hypothetical protein
MRSGKSLHDSNHRDEDKRRTNGPKDAGATNDGTKRRIGPEALLGRGLQQEDRQRYHQADEHATDLPRVREPRRWLVPEIEQHRQMDRDDNRHHERELGEHRHAPNTFKRPFKSARLSHPAQLTLGEPAD